MNRISSPHAKRSIRHMLLCLLLISVVSLITPISYAADLAAPKINAAEASDNSIKLSWENVADASKYILYRKEPGQALSKLKTLSADTSYTDSAVKPGHTYIYSVAAADASSEGTKSAEVSATMELPAPEFQLLELQNSTIALRWSGVDGAESYNVYRRTLDTQFSFIGNCTSTSYVDTTYTPGITYYYSIRARVTTGTDHTLSARSEEKTITIAPSKPKMQNVSVSGTSIKLKWSSVANAGYYILYRKTNGESYQRLATLTSNSYMDSSLSIGKAYSYTVRTGVTYNGLPYLSECSNTMSVDYPVSKPILKQAASGSGYIALNWGPVSSASGYYIYRKSGSGKWQQIASTYSSVQTGYWDWSASPGITYKYSVAAYIKNGSQKLAGPYNTTGMSSTARLETPTIKSLSSGGTLKWYSSAAAQSYIVYSRKSASASWTKLSTIQSTGASSYSYKVKNAKLQYSVRALKRVNGKNLYSKYAAYITVDNAYSGKVLVCGDSLTYGRVSDGHTAKVTFAQRLSQTLHCTVTAKGYPSICVSSGSSSDTRSFVEIVKKGEISFKGYDVICLELGSNDYSHDAYIGSTKSTAITTIYGAYKYVISRIKKQNPSAKIVLITPTYRGRVGSNYEADCVTHANGRGHTLLNYVGAVRKCAELNNVYLYDLYAANIITQSKVYQTTGDLVHPTQETYLKIGDSLASYLRKCGALKK